MKTWEFDPTSSFSVLASCSAILQIMAASSYSAQPRGIKQHAILTKGENFPAELRMKG
jgi:hypothetical protein